MTTIAGILEEQSRRDHASCAAILAPGRAPLSYQKLWQFVQQAGRQFRAQGIRRNSRVAMVLPNGPEMAVAFMAVGVCATAAPLNPTYKKSEYDFYLNDLHAGALLVLEGSDSPAIEAAREQKIPVVAIVPGKEEAGLFTLPTPAAENLDFAEADDCVLVLHTSGTTARPKVVPLTQRNLCVSAAAIRDSLALTPTDCALNVMPLFHVHGLVGVLLSSIAAGASVFCAPGFLAPRFFDWMEEASPTWYSAVPSIHQAILARAQGHRPRRLRFLRSASASLPPQVMNELEDTFGVPVLEAYGMTEASHQVAVNPLPPRERKPGSVGLATGTRITIAPGSGEVLIRGESVIGAYENNPEANEQAFEEGWFHTGDLGRLDADGYLFLQGRLKETINRGGEKISPREVEEALLDHPAVRDVAVFPIPDAQLGQVVGAAVVTGSAITAAELRQFAAERLADFKVPAQIVFVEAIPKSTIGKVQRLMLAGQLGLKAVAEARPGPRTEYAAPRSETEQHLVKIWSECLGVERVGIHDLFVDLGGDSILAAQLVERIGREWMVDLKLIGFFDHPTVESQATFIDQRLREIRQELDGLERLSEEEAARLLKEGT